MISFNNQDIDFKLKDKLLLKRWIKAVIVKKKRKEGEIGFVFCSDEFLHGINKKYLDHDTYTDIITFDYSKENSKMPVSGEIYISVERVGENAKKFAKPFEEELHRVIIHGILHLLGYMDKTKSAKTEMTKQEDDCLRALKKVKKAPAKKSEAELQRDFFLVMLNHGATFV
jgi:probable rRNA maturation factor